jgi:hypothetical protein
LEEGRMGEGVRNPGLQNRNNRNRRFWASVFSLVYRTVNQ